MATGGPTQQTLNLSSQTGLIGGGSLLAIYELFNAGAETFPNVPSFDLRFEGNAAAMGTPASQPDLNRGILQFAGTRVFNHLPFSDDPLVPGSTVIKALHITELRSRIDALRLRVQLFPFSYTDPAPTPGVTVVTARYISELRSALADVYVAEGLVPPGYTDATLVPGLTVIKAIHITELRDFVGALE